jgi:hypothetical protein
MSSTSEYRRALVATQFHRARRQAALESLLSRLSGHTADLLSFDEVVSKLGMSGQASLGVQQIPIEAIVGSVGRYKDFSRTFLPRLESDEDRWVRVGAAAPSVAQLPPIDVYKVGDSYFVLDGNHRVSLARQQRLHFIDAAVIEVRTRAPLPPGASPDDLIIAAEYAAFLVLTQLDILRPECDLRVSVPGQYSHLESHIEAWRYLLENDEGRELSHAEAAGRWYDEVYLPLVQAIREQGILRYFPSRTETDFFVWLARHRAELENELGLTISPDVAVARLVARLSQTQPVHAGPAGGRLRRLTRLMLPEAMPPRTWAEERTLGRYSDHLFANLLYPLVIDEESGQGPNEAVLQLAVALAERERAQLCALCVLAGDEPTPGERAMLEHLRATIDTGQCELLIERGDAVDRVRQVAFLNDLIVLERTFGGQRPDKAGPAAAVRTILTEATRPLLITGPSPCDPAGDRALLVHDTRLPFDEALFIATYMAEAWRVALAVLPIANGRDTETVVARVGDYLALHEVQAAFREPVRPSNGLAEAIIDAAHAADAKLIILSAAGRGRKTARGNPFMDVIWAILHQWPHSILIAT